jgi:hypothetical protein
VKFLSPKRGEKFSSSSYQESSVSKSAGVGRGKQMLEVEEDIIGESIKIEESYGGSNMSGSRSKKSAQTASMRQSKKSGHSMPRSRSREDSADSFERDEEVDYSEDFIGESLPSGSKASRSDKAGLHSAKALQQKAADIEGSGYTDVFEDVSIGQSQGQSNRLRGSINGKGKVGAQIGVVDEEEDSGQASSHLKSDGEGSSPQGRDSSRLGSSHVDQSGELRESAPSPPKPGHEELTDREVSQSTGSVDWQIMLQGKAQQWRPDELRRSSPTQDLQESLVEEQVEESDIGADQLQDLESCPSGSLGQSRPEDSQDFELKVDQITDELLNAILQDFKQDGDVKLEVEDVDEAAFADKWPYTLDKRLEEKEAPVPKPPVPQASAQQEEEKKLQAEREAENEAKRKHDKAMAKYHEEQRVLAAQQAQVVEYLDFMVEIVDKEVLMQALAKPIEHDPLKILEKIQAFDTEEEPDITALAYSQQQSALPPDLFDEIEKRFEEMRLAKEGGEPKEESKVNSSAMSQETRNIYHLGIFDAFNEALDQERPYRFKGLPNPWSRQTRVTNETLSATQVEAIIKKARARVIEWDKTGAGTKFAPPPPPPPPPGDFDPSQVPQDRVDNEEERNKAERQERLGQLLTKEVHQREEDWLDYEIEDTQVRFDLADMILEELADEVTQFLMEKGGPLPADMLD